MGKLRYTSTDKPGYSRKKWGRGFTYQDENGETINDSEIREWIESIVIPPAWTEVWINPNQNGHILATGRDDKGRKQYCYHPLWLEISSEKKFDELYEFGKHLPAIRRTVDEHLRQRKVSRERVLAAIVRLLETTLIRIGNQEYAQNNDSYGLTTMTDDHVEIDGTKVIFDFVGKSGIEHTILLKDSRLARIVKHCQDVPGYALFQYYTDDGEPKSVDSSDVNSYLQDITGEPFTAKIFRTWGGSTLSIKYLCENGADSEIEVSVRDCIEFVAKALGNTKTVCKDYYIHPYIWDAYRDSSLQPIYDKYQSNDDALSLSREEQTLMKLIEQAKS